MKVAGLTVVSYFLPMPKPLRVEYGTAAKSILLKQLTATDKAICDGLAGAPTAPWIAGATGDMFRYEAE